MSALILTALLLAQDVAFEAPPSAPILSINPSCWPTEGWLSTATPVNGRIDLPPGDSLPTWQRVAWTVPGGWAHLTGDLGELCVHRDGTLSRHGIPGVSGWPPDGFRVTDGSRWVDGVGLVLLSGLSGQGWTRGLVAVWDGAGSVRTYWLEGFLPGAVESLGDRTLALLEPFQVEPVTALGCLDLDSGAFWRPETGPVLTWGKALARVGDELWASATHPEAIQVYRVGKSPQWVREIPVGLPVEAFVVRKDVVYTRSTIGAERLDWSGRWTAGIWFPVPAAWSMPPYSLAWDERDGGHLLAQFNVASETGPWLLCRVDPDLSGRYEAADPMPGVIGPIHPWRKP